MFLLGLPSPDWVTIASRYDEWFKPMHNFDDYLAEKCQLQNAKEPDDPLFNPYTFYRKQEGTPVWTIMSQDPERFQTFQTGMAGIDLAIPVVGHFDFDSLRNSPAEVASRRIQLVDVGGGHGAVLKRILDLHKDSLDPNTCILQDRTEVIALSRANNILPGEVERQEHDFMAEQPVKGERGWWTKTVSYEADGRELQVQRHISCA